MICRAGENRPTAVLLCDIKACLANLGSFEVPTKSSRPPIWTEANLHLAIEAAGVALWSWNVDTDKPTMDESGYRLWGVPVSEFVAFEDLSSHIHPADRDRV